MYKVSQAYKDTVYKGHTRESSIKGFLTLNKTDETGKYIKIKFTGKDIKLGSLNIERSAVNSNDLNIGSVYAAHFSVDMLSKTDRYDIDRYSTYGGHITFTYSLKCIDGTTQIIPLGYFEITEGRRNGDYIRLGGYDGMLKLDKAIDFGSADALSGDPYTLAFSMINRQCGLRMDISQQEIDALSPVDGSGKIYVFKVTKGGTCRTCRDVLSKLAQILGGFFYVDREEYRTEDGRVIPSVKFSKFSGDGVIDATVEDQYRNKAEIYDFTCEYSGVSANTEDETLIYGDNTKLVLSLGDFPLELSGSYSDLKTEYKRIMGQIYEKALKGIKYTPCDLEFAGDPAIDLGDAIKLTGRNCDPVNGTILLVMANKWRYHGNQQLHCYGKDQALSKTQQIKSQRFKGDVSKEAQTIINNQIVSGDKRIFAQFTSGTYRVYSTTGEMKLGDILITPLEGQDTVNDVQINAVYHYSLHETDPQSTQKDALARGTIHTLEPPLDPRNHMRGSGEITVWEPFAGSSSITGPAASQYTIPVNAVGTAPVIANNNGRTRIELLSLIYGGITNRRQIEAYVYVELVVSAPAAKIQFEYPKKS